MTQEGGTWEGDGTDDGADDAIGELLYDVLRAIVGPGVHLAVDQSIEMGTNGEKPPAQVVLDVDMDPVVLGRMFYLAGFKNRKLVWELAKLIAGRQGYRSLVKWLGEPEFPVDDEAD